ncbi:hypothetical protein QTP88_016123 [Uroleucon formosanum]
MLLDLRFHQLVTSMRLANINKNKNMVTWIHPKSMCLPCQTAHTPHDHPMYSIGPRDSREMKQNYA